MSAKNTARIALLLFVAASVVVLTVKSLRQAAPSASAGEEQGKMLAGKVENEMPSASTLRSDRLVAYYFHGKLRCPTCKKIEAYAHEAVKSGFAQELKQGCIQWKVVNYEQPGNQHFATDYELAAPSVVLVQVRGGKEKNWKNIAEVWELVGDKPAFTALVQKEISEMLKQIEEH